MLIYKVETVLKNFFAEGAKGGGIMIKRSWVTAMVFLFLVVSTVVLFVAGHYSLFVIAVGVMAFVVGASIATNIYLGRPIPFKALRSREFILSRRIDSSLSLVITAGEGFCVARLVEGCPENIEEGELFIPWKDGLTSVVTRH